MRTDQQPRDEEVDMQALEQGEQMQLEVSVDFQSERDQFSLQNPQKLCEVVDEFLERLRPMKQLGFIRQNRTVYCIVCLKYVKSFHECNWRHTPAEDRVAEMWYRSAEKRLVTRGDLDFHVYPYKMLAFLFQTLRPRKAHWKESIGS